MPSILRVQSLSGIFYFVKVILFFITGLNGNIRLLVFESVYNRIRKGKDIGMFRIESLLSARLFLRPQLVGERIFFISNLSGHLSLYAMNYGGSVPEPLLPTDLALQNPHLVTGKSFYVFPKAGKILVMVDHHGDENYQPMVIPLQGGFPTPAFGDKFDPFRVYCMHCDAQTNIVYLLAASRHEQVYTAYQGNLDTKYLQKLRESPWGAAIDGFNQENTRAILIDRYMIGDHVLYLWERGESEPRLLYGVPLESRTAGQEITPNAISFTNFTPDDRGLLFCTTLFDDLLGLGYLKLNEPDRVRPVTVAGATHQGSGQLEEVRHLKDNHYLLLYNIDGSSWAYEGIFDEQSLHMNLEQVIAGQDMLSGGVLEAIEYDKNSNRYALAFSTATSPTQIYTMGGKDRRNVERHTNERVLGIPDGWLAPGEDASYISFDGTRVSARLYRPAEALGFEGSRPVVYYVHGGPHSQERPDFAWFSIPLIQFLTLNGFAVFVPNVRGSSGYGLSYSRKVDRDWGGNDRLDHVHAMQAVLPNDQRLDTTRAAVVGRSYGGYMSLTLASRHPELWSAAVDMFGPFDLLTFLERIPETWKPYYRVALGDPQEDREFLVERSPRTHIDQITCPLLVIQGKNDPRVVERESHDLVEDLRSKGKEVEYLMFDNEGHDVLKLENRVTCYNTITEFFRKHLNP